MTGSSLIYLRLNTGIYLPACFDGIPVFYSMRLSILRHLPFSMSCSPRRCAVSLVSSSSLVSQLSMKWSCFSRKKVVGGGEVGGGGIVSSRSTMMS